MRFIVWILQLTGICFIISEKISDIEKYSLEFDTTIV